MSFSESISILSSALDGRDDYPLGEKAARPIINVKEGRVSGRLVTMSYPDVAISTDHVDAMKAFGKVLLKENPATSPPTVYGLTTSTVKKYLAENASEELKTQLFETCLMQWEQRGNAEILDVQEALDELMIPTSDANRDRFVVAKILRDCFYKKETELNLQGYNIRDLPWCIIMLSGLKKLCLSDNKLLSLNDLPKNLKTLQINETAFEEPLNLPPTVEFLDVSDAKKEKHVWRALAKDGSLIILQTIKDEKGHSETNV